MKLAGQRALVTGAGSGIGRAIALALAEEGADVVVHYYSNAEGAATVVDEIVARGRRGTGIQADLAATGEAHRVVSAATEFFRDDLTIVANNSGHLVERCPIENMSDELWSTIMSVNAYTTFAVCRAAIPSLRAASGGAIVNMSSAAARFGGGSGSSAYAASKAAVEGLTRSLAKELAPDGIRVNAVAPGFIGQTAFHDTFTPADRRAAAVAGIPVGREGVPWDVAAGVVFLCAPDSSFITGTMLDIDGGLLVR